MPGVVRPGQAVRRRQDVVPADEHTPAALVVVPVKQQRRPRELIDLRERSLDLVLKRLHAALVAVVFTESGGEIGC